MNEVHIGLIGGIGPAATEFYYRTLVKLYAQAGKRLELTIANADARELVFHMEANDPAAQAAIFAEHIDKLKAGGCSAVALTSMGAHFCMEHLEPRSSLPLISAVRALEDYFKVLEVKRVGALGSRAAMQSKLYGISTVEVILLPTDEAQDVHVQYTSIAVSGKATDEQRAFFENAATRLIDIHGADAIVLGGTDLFLAFNKADYPFVVVDAAEVHSQAIARIGLG